MYASAGSQKTPTAFSADCVDIQRGRDSGSGRAAAPRTLKDGAHGLVLLDARDPRRDAVDLLAVLRGDADLVVGRVAGYEQGMSRV